MKPFAVLLTVLFCFYSPLQAAPLSAYLALGGEAGGAQVNSVAGKPIEEISIGAGLNMSLGVKLDVSKTRPHAYEARAHVGFNAWETGNGEDNTSTWVSLPVYLEYFYVNTRNHFKVGYGLTYRFSNSLDTERMGVINDFRFEDSLGYTLAVERYSPVLDGETAFGLRYTSIDYKEVSTDQIFDGDSIGYYMALTID